jgi:hypothetical protein
MKNKAGLANLVRKPSEKRETHTLNGLTIPDGNLGPGI